MKGYRSEYERGVKAQKIVDIIKDADPKTFLEPDMLTDSKKKEFIYSYIFSRYKEELPKEEELGTWVMKHTEKPFKLGNKEFKNGDVIAKILSNISGNKKFYEDF